MKVKQRVSWLIDHALRAGKYQHILITLDVSLSVEFRGLKNQDITIRKLESKIAELEEKKEEEIQKELK